MVKKRVKQRSEDCDRDDEIDWKKLVKYNVNPKLNFTFLG